MLDAVGTLLASYNVLDMSTFIRCYVRTLPRDILQLTPQQCVGNLFVDLAGKCCVLQDEDAMLQANFWEGALPHHVYLVAPQEPIEPGDWYLPPGGQAPRQRGQEYVSQAAERVELSTDERVHGLPPDFLDYLARVGCSPLDFVDVHRYSDHTCLYNRQGELVGSHGVCPLCLP